MHGTSSTSIAKGAEKGFAPVNTCARHGGAQVKSELALLRFAASRWSYRQFRTPVLLDPSSRILHLESRQHSCGIHARADAVPHKPCLDDALE
jgi:hypothetical protein